MFGHHSLCLLVAKVQPMADAGLLSSLRPVTMVARPRKPLYCFFVAGGQLQRNVQLLVVRCEDVVQLGHTCEAVRV